MVFTTREINNLNVFLIKGDKMKLNGNKLVLTKEEWASIGSKAGWTKTAAFDQVENKDKGMPGVSTMDPKMKYDEYIFDENSEFGKFAGNVKEVSELIKKMTNKGDPRSLDMAKSLVSSLPHFLILHGEPGSGKASFAEVLADLLGFKLIDLDVNVNYPIGNVINTVSNSVIRIDINERSSGSVALLHALQEGLSRLTSNNVFVIVTTQKPGDLGSPMLNRGMVFEVKHPSGIPKIK